MPGGRELENRIAFNRFRQFKLPKRAEPFFRAPSNNHVFLITRGMKHRYIHVIPLKGKDKRCVAVGIDGIIKDTIYVDNIYEALNTLSSKEKKTIVVFGSLYLIGDVLSKN